MEAQQGAHHEEEPPGLTSQSPENRPETSGNVAFPAERGVGIFEKFSGSFQEFSEKRSFLKFF